MGLGSPSLLLPLLVFGVAACTSASSNFHGEIARVDAARIHYDALSFAGTTSPDILKALTPQRQRFDVRPGGTVLVHGAGGAMGRIHVHRLLQLEDGPSTVIATSRSRRRQSDLEEDFAALAKTQGKRLVVVEVDEGLGRVFEVEDIQPAPDRSEALPHGQRLVFRLGQAGGGKVTVHVRALRPSLGARAEVRIDGRPLTLSPVVLP